ncbi:MAG: DUF6316 family protein [Halioglobus sp.]
MQRAGDSGNTHSWFRSDRMIEEAGKWFFQTREGSIEGPFGTQSDAVCSLEAYIGSKALDLTSEWDGLGTDSDTDTDVVVQ